MKRFCIAVLLGCFVLGGCGASPESDPGLAAPSPSELAGPSVGPPPTAPATAGPVPRIDWRHPVNTDFGDGWALGPCGGDAPLVCVTRRHRQVGSLEVLQFSVSSLTAVSTALRLRGEEEALRAHAAAFLAGIVADRHRGCGSDYA